MHPLEPGFWMPFPEHERSAFRNNNWKSDANALGRRCRHPGPQIRFSAKWPIDADDGRGHERNDLIEMPRD